ncbi:MAG: hypothetical protein J2O49_04785 [Sciscionella sp.]|nr:hypothetical protein [Sciscionella sp.]
MREDPFVTDERSREDPFVTDELIGLDRDDPETKAFAEHLARMRQQHPNYTVEGYLANVSEFANSANRARGHHRMMALLVVGLILLGVGWAVWRALGDVINTFVFK